MTWEPSVKNKEMNKDIKIAVAGTGYVGMSIATLLSQHHHVTAVDIVAEKVDKINHRLSPIVDKEIEEYLANKPLQLEATMDAAKAYSDAHFVVIAAPTNYDSKRNFFDTVYDCVWENAYDGGELGETILGIPGRVIGSVSGAGTGIIRGFFESIFG